MVIKIKNQLPTGIKWPVTTLDNWVTTIFIMIFVVHMHSRFCHKTAYFLRDWVQSLTFCTLVKYPHITMQKLMAGYAHRYLYGVYKRKFFYPLKNVQDLL